MQYNFQGTYKKRNQKEVRCDRDFPWLMVFKQHVNGKDTLMLVPRPGEKMGMDRAYGLSTHLLRT